MMKQSKKHLQKKAASDRNKIKGTNDSMKKESEKSISNS